MNIAPTISTIKLYKCSILNSMVLNKSPFRKDKFLDDIIKKSAQHIRVCIPQKNFVFITSFLAQF